MKLDLGNFRTWITKNKKLSESTANLYVTVVRAFLRDRETAIELTSNPKRFSEYAIRYDSDLQGQARSSFRSGLRAFMAYAKATKGGSLSVAFPDLRRGPRESRTVEREPHPLGPLLRQLEERGVNFNRIPLIFWRDVEGATAGEPVTIRKGRRVAWRLPYELVKSLNFWAGGGTWAARDQPFIPYEPGGRSPMPAKRLARIARS